MKTCTKCSETKDFHEFYRDGDRWYAQCIECIKARRREHHAANKDRIKVKKAEWYSTNTGQCHCGRSKSPRADVCRWCFDDGGLASSDPQQQLCALLSRADDTPVGCALWDGALSADGYAMITVKKKQIRAYRLVFELINGAIPPGYTVHHKCANRQCVSPDHLELSSTRENVGEMLARQGFLAHIAALEDALRELAPDHPLLNLATNTETGVGMPGEVAA